MKSIIQKLAFFSWAQIHSNPRSREGSDESSAVSKPTNSISIHAPVKGATSYYHGYLTNLRNFNPRSREGSDQYFFG